MTRLAVLTPSIAADYELCADLNRSVLAQSAGTVEHHIVVPGRDMALFERLRGPRTIVRRETDFLPRSFVPVPRTKYTLNVRRPYPPLRGWILQQIIKLAAAAEIPADVVVMADSDITFCRPLGAETFVRDGVVRLFREPGGVHDGMPRHVQWHHAARTLLGLPGGQPPFTDYVSSMLAWDPAVVRAMLARVTEVTGRPWADAIGAHLHFSEWTLYGVFVDRVLGAPANSFASDDPLCHTYWLEDPLDEVGLAAFLAGIEPEDIAVMVSAKSRTPLALRRAAMAGLGAPQ
jgi:hypothetical protein